METEAEPTMEPTLGYYSSYFTEREMEIADIMIQLPDIISELDKRPRLRVPWGITKRRSAIAGRQDQQQQVQQQVQQVHQQHAKKKTIVRLRLPSSSNPRTLPKTPAAPIVVKVKSSSPNTPLSLSASTESDEKPRSKVNGKRKREDWEKIIDQLDKRRQVLLNEVKKVQDHRDKSEGLNRVLKERKQVLAQKNAGVKIEEQRLNLQISPPPLAPDTIIYPHLVPAFVKQEHYYQPPPNILPQHQLELLVMPQNQINVSSTTTTTTTQMASTPLPLSNSVTAAGYRPYSRLVDYSDSGAYLGVYPDYLADQTQCRALTAAQAARRHRIEKHKVKKSSCKVRVKTSSSSLANRPSHMTT